jgi:hypothetical protein
LTEENLAYLHTCLGDQIQVIGIVPDASAIGKHEHVNNLVLAVQYGNRSFIFPGDANQEWFNNNCKKLEELLSQLGGIDFLLLPHHGSMEDTGLLMKDAIEHYNNNHDTGKCMACLISGNHAHGPYYIPRYGIHLLFSHDRRIKPHILRLTEVVSATHREEVTVSTNCPVFSTADTNNGYKIICNGNNVEIYRDLIIAEDNKVFDSSILN